MALHDFLNRTEIEFFQKAFKLEIDFFNRDLSMLFNNKVTVADAEYSYLEPDTILPLLNKQFILLVLRWEGDCPGESLIVFQIADAKILCGLRMMMSPSDIKQTMKNAFGADDLALFKQIAGQLNDSADNALREYFNFDFRTILKEARVITLQEAGSIFKQIFSASGYLSIASTLKISDFHDSVMRQFITRDMIKNISRLLKLKNGNSDEEEEKEAPRCVLIVDDDPEVHKKMKECLEGLTVDVLEASDGVEAMQVLIRSAVGLIILDLEMPNMNGVETCQRIRQNPQTRNIPIIMCSTKSTRENVLTAVNNGARDFIVKPITDKESFRARVIRYMNLTQ
jgi:twitching motility two-component system response regulator PilH